jgi:hypothetical protein
MKLYRLIDQDDDLMASAVTNEGIDERKLAKTLTAKAERLGVRLEITTLGTMADLVNELDELDSFLTHLANE